ncbi:MAG: hypothetical protein U1E05_18650 [Patescibacteria group bacterium]|nr:hypothetical protein [Patescibacteria group bacterium]
MSQMTQQHVHVHPLLVTLFGPIRWWRYQWAHTWFKVVSVSLASVVLLLILSQWTGCSTQSTWENWLDDFRFRGSRNASSKTGTSSATPKTPRNEGAATAYLGKGRAELGEYSICVFDPVTQSTLRTDFRLEGVTRLPDEASFDQFMNRNGRFFREQVAVVLRTHNVDDLVKPDLQLLSRKIVARVNRSLGNKVLESAKIKNFSLQESIDQSGFVPHESEEDGGLP